MKEKDGRKMRGKERAGARIFEEEGGQEVSQWIANKERGQRQEEMGTCSVDRTQVEIPAV